MRRSGAGRWAVAAAAWAVLALASSAPEAVASGASMASMASAAAGAASDDSVRLTLDVPDAAGLYDASEGADARYETFPMLVSPHGGTATDVEVVVDARALRKVGTLTPGHRCTGEADVFRCRFDPGDLKYAAHFRPFYLRGKDGVAPGDGGVVRLTARAGNAPTVHARTLMRVRPPDLTAEAPRRVAGRAAPGEAVALRPSFANRGRWPVHGFALRLSTYGSHLTLDRRYRNCWYSRDQSEAGDRGQAWCHFDTTLSARGAWRPARPLVGRLEKNMPAESVRYTLEYAERDEKVFSERGDGPELGLERIDAKKVRGGSPSSSLRVDGTAQMDYAAVVKGTVRGRVGDTVDLRVGVRNANGGRLPGINPDHLEITPPPGTTITGTPYSLEGDPMQACTRSRARERVWICPLKSLAFAPPLDSHRGATSTLRVRVRIDDKVVGARGTVRTVGAYDRSHADDTAAIPTAVTTPSRLALVLTATGAGVVLLALAVPLLVLRRRRRLRRGRPKAREATP